MTGAVSLRMILRNESMEDRGGILEGRSFELGKKLTSRSERLVWEMKASDQFLRARGAFADYRRPIVDFRIFAR